MPTDGDGHASHYYGKIVTRFAPRPARYVIKEMKFHQEGGENHKKPCTEGNRSEDWAAIV